MSKLRRDHDLVRRNTTYSQVTKRRSLVFKDRKGTKGLTSSVTRVRQQPQISTNSINAAHVGQHFVHDNLTNVVDSIHTSNNHNLPTFSRQRHTKHTVTQSNKRRFSNFRRVNFTRTVLTRRSVRT